MVTFQQKLLVQDSFAALVPVLDDAMALFYRRLFEVNPTLIELFPHDMTGQRRKLAQMLGAAVNGLDRVEQLVPVLQNLGQRHAAYGVTDAHYDAVGSALLWTLQTGLGPAFTPEVRDAWTAVYGLVAGVMKDAAHIATAVAAA